MAKKSMKDALQSTIKAEDTAFQRRVDAAESLLGGQPQTAQEKDALPQKELETVQPEPKTKVIRDSFTLPSGDYELIATLQQRCLHSAVNANKSEIIRAGLQILNRMSDEELVEAINSLEKVKTGRPSTKV
jgi:hypothetical protein